MPDLPLPLYTAEKAKALDREAIEKHQIPGIQLMERAGQFAFDCLVKKWPLAKEITVVCGTGNNGGDGYVLARLAQEKGLVVKVYEVGQREESSSKSTSDALTAREALLATGVQLKPFDASIPLAGDVIVDALLGTGIRAPLKPEWQDVILAMNQASAPKLGIDLPSGLSADRGSIVDVAVKCELTVTFVGLKLGLFTGAGVGLAGEVLFSALEVPREIYDKVPPDAMRMDYFLALRPLPTRAKDAHKGDFGHVCIVGAGEAQYGGAACLAGLGALEAGAGLVSVAHAPVASSRVMSQASPELMCYGIEPKVLSELLQKVSTIVCGPGLGQSKWAKGCLELVIKSDLPAIVDADGLNGLSQWFPKTHKKNWILTPHPGEAAKLLNISTAEVQADRLKAAKQLLSQFGGVVVLKGAGTIVVTEGEPPWICTQGNPGMATGGMGDVLAGLIGGLLAQKLSLFEAACLGTIVHAMAGDLEQVMGQRGMVASDLLLHVRSLLNPN